MTTRLIAHRGIHQTFLENSLEAFREAIFQNKIIELDIRLLKDNEVIVFHDSNLKRLFGVDRDLCDLTLEEVKKYGDVPTLEESLKLIRGRVPVIVEVKSFLLVGSLERIASQILDRYEGEFAVLSFHPLSLLWFRMNRPQYVLGYLVNSLFSTNFLLEIFLNYRLVLRRLKPDYILINLSSLRSRKVQKLRHKYLVIGYTITTKSQYLEYVLGSSRQYADNFICDYFF